MVAAVLCLVYNLVSVYQFNCLLMYINSVNYYLLKKKTSEQHNFQGLGEGMFCEPPELEHIEDFG